jgi:hypothetical protein
MVVKRQNKGALKVYRNNSVAIKQIKINVQKSLKTCIFQQIEGNSYDIS